MTTGSQYRPEHPCFPTRRRGGAEKAGDRGEFCLRAFDSAGKRAFVLPVALLIGCTTPKGPQPEVVPEPPDAAEVQAAEKLFEAGRIQEAVAACVDINRKRPEARGLLQLERKINARLAEERAEKARVHAEKLSALGSADAERFNTLPPNYRQIQHVMGEQAPLRTAPTAMQKVLNKLIDIHLVDADLNSIIAQIGMSENVNIVADSALSDLEKRLTIHAEKTPLLEVLEYIGRNLGVNFSVGRNLIWVTPKTDESAATVPMETRVYRLRKGLIGSELGRSAKGESLFKGPEERRSSSRRNESRNNQEEAAEQKIGLIESIQRFVPQPDGADLLFNDRVHALIVKNTRENLALVEDLIDAMDVRPLQILIEARFVRTDISDFSKLGVEWLMDNRGVSRFDSGSLSTTDPWTRGQTEVANARRDVFSTALQSVSTSDGGAVGGASVAYQFLLGDTALKAVLNALDANGDTQTIVVPRITTLNNREARFRVGEDIEYFEEVDTQIMTSGSSYGNGESRDNVTYDYDEPTVVEVGKSLIVTPSVGSDLSTINLVLRPEISSVKEWRKYRLSSLHSGDANNEPAIEIPTLARQYIETEAVVRSGETVVLGGLVDNVKEEETGGTPWLSKIPLLGYLFKTEDKKKVNRNLLIFVTATLISDTGEDLIPLNDAERYGLPVRGFDRTPNILKPAAPKGPAGADAAQAAEAAAAKAAAARRAARRAEAEALAAQRAASATDAPPAPQAAAKPADAAAKARAAAKAEAAGREAKAADQLPAEPVAKPAAVEPKARPAAVPPVKPLLLDVNAEKK